MPFYAGLRIGEAVALDVSDVYLSARKGHVVVRSGKGSRYREVPLHPELREQLAIWINDERPGWPRADTNPALFLNARGGRLGGCAVPATSWPASRRTPASTLRISLGGGITLIALSVR